MWGGLHSAGFPGRLFLLFLITSTLRFADKYVELRAEDDVAVEAVDPRMTGIVERVFERCYVDGGEPPTTEPHLFN